MNKNFIDKFNKYFALILVLEYFIMQIMYISYDSWSLIESLPFHLCTLMTFILFLFY